VSFAPAVWRLVRRIPRGRVATYGQLAALLGRPRAARAVGRAMRDCPGDVPWHRVVNASGGISRRARMESMLTQRMLLVGEGIVLRNGRVRLSRHRWRAADQARDGACRGAPRRDRGVPIVGGRGGGSGPPVGVK
jgi:methylated-DNA-protein-cysteine methyltransferase-like protein